jgi:ketosteroid isomerase-like protein
MRNCLKLIVLAVAALLLASCGSAELDEVTARRDILALIKQQQDDWNAGSTEAFMRGYVKSDSLRFASGDTVYYGWAATMERYRRAYPDRAAMGVLTFSDLDIKILGPDAALVFGKYMLQREADRPWGLFTLLFLKTDAGWRIVHDHTSAAPQ